MKRLRLKRCAVKEGMTRMTRNDGKNERRQGRERVGPSMNAGVAQGASRVSKAAGSIGSESMRVEQHSKVPSSTASNTNKPTVRRQASTKRTPGGKQPTRANPPSRSRSVPAAPGKATGDTRLIDSLRQGWASMQ